MSGTRLQIAVILHRQTKCAMTGYGLIAVIPAYRQYKNAMERYDNLVEHQEALRAAVGMYNAHKMDDYYLSHLVDEKQDTPAPGLLIAPMLRVGALVGKLFRCQASVVMTNTSDRTIGFYKGISVESVLLDSPVKVYKIAMNWAMDVKEEDVPQRIDKTFQLKPGETIEVMIPGGISGLGDKQEELRQIICKAAGKNLITSCPKISIENGARADIMYWWYYADEGIEKRKRCYTVGVPGMLRYCGEVYWPEEVK